MHVYVAMQVTYIDYTYNYIIIYIYTYSRTCALWTPWDQPMVSRLCRCPHFQVSRLTGSTVYIDLQVIML